MIYICTLLLALILIAAAIGVGVWLVLSAKDEEKPPQQQQPGKYVAHYGFDWCLKELNQSQHYECAMVLPPPADPQDDMCNHPIKCVDNVFYAADTSNHEFLKPSTKKKEIIVETKYSRKYLVCGRKDKPICDDDYPNSTGSPKCSFTWNSKDKLFDQNLTSWKPHWDDNCDVPDDCWRTPFPSLDDKTSSLKIDNRTRCLESVPCPDDGITAAVIWLQHLRCDLHREHVSLSYCRATTKGESYPMQLWKCRDCESNPKKRDEIVDSAIAAKVCGDKDKTVTSQGQCRVTCGGGTKEEAMPSGTPCDSGFCVAGTCFSTGDFKVWASDPDRHRIRSASACAHHKESHTHKHGGRHFTYEKVLNQTLKEQTEVESVKPM